MISGLRISVFNCIAAGAFVAIGFLPPMPAKAQTQQQIDWCMNKGNAFSPDERISGCTAMIRSRRQTPHNILAIEYAFRGVAYDAKDDYDRAIADYTEAIRLNPKYAHAYYFRGLAYFGKKDYDRAIADYDQAIQLDPKNVLSYDFRGSAYGAKGDYDRAIADYDQAIQLDPKGALAYYLRGLAKQMRGDNAGGDADIAKARQLDPNVGQ